MLLAFTFILLDYCLTHWLRNGVELSMDNFILFLSYTGPALGVLLAYKLSRMKSLTFVNLMFLFYFCLDSFIGFFQTFNLGKLKREKYVSILSSANFIDANISSNLENDNLNHKQNCFNVITLWMISLSGKGRYHCGLMFCRYHRCAYWFY